MQPGGVDPVVGRSGRSRPRRSVVRDLGDGVHRVDDLVAHLGISRTVLAGRLAELVAVGAVERVDHREPGSRRRQE
ncbi:winged helix-turn-helix transcriptional regulator, partial [Pseudonocardia sp. KRD-188]